VDLGIKASTPRRMGLRGCEVNVLPADATADQILAAGPDGVFFSNGPGDPAATGYAVAAMRGVLDAGVPVFGICFGSQILARALGSEALASERHEIGWVPVRSDDPALVAEGPWFQWHHDTFRPPARAALLADSPAGPQAYTVGRSLGVQFHPEVTVPIVEEWVALGGEDLARHGIDPDQLMAETREREDENRARAWRLLDTFVDRVGLA